MELRNTVVLHYSRGSGSDAETPLRGGRAREWGQDAEGLQELEQRCPGPSPAAALEIYDLGHSPHLSEPQLPIFQMGPTVTKVHLGLSRQVTKAQVPLSNAPGGR